MSRYGYEPKHATGRTYEAEPRLDMDAYQPRHASDLVRVTVGAHGIDRGYREDVRFLPLTGPQSLGGAW